ncbi:MAG TPA: anti-sigma factor, partial [Haliea salexigens]|nr:anti-sigma factor [Haliea salexigens]
ALTDAGVPVSLGLLPQSGSLTISLGSAERAALERSSTLAVSLEPPGGSPKAVPTGPVLYTAPLLAS